MNNYFSLDIFAVSSLDIFGVILKIRFACQHIYISLKILKKLLNNFTIFFYNEFNTIYTNLVLLSLDTSTFSSLLAL